MTQHQVISCTYDLYVDGENNGQEELMEKATEQHPLTYCEGIGMMLPKFEEALHGLQKGQKFDFRIACQNAYGEYDTDSVMQLDKCMFNNGDGEFDSERVQVGLIVPMNTVDGKVVNAQVCEITDTHVTIDLNHPLAGENLHFVGEVMSVRPATDKEIEALTHPHHCHCHGNCHGDCNSECHGDCNGECNDKCNK